MSTVFADIRQAVDKHIEQVLESCPYPASLYDPIRYVMRIGGKRVRPILVILAARSLKASMESVLDVAVAVELLHNFTLVHDDIMDRDDIRRGQPTIHAKWDEGTAILAGDALIGIAYRRLSRLKTERLGELIRTFTDAVVEVCEGQALDKEFEGREEVSLAEYEDMIARKTGRLISMSSKIGALAAGGDPEQVEALERYGSLIGKAFQIQDDLLDYLSTTEELGKAVGSDLAMRKATYVTLEAAERLSGESLRRFKELLGDHGSGVSEELRRLLKEAGVLDSGRRAVEALMDQALLAVEDILESDGNSELRRFADWILRRRY